jgi:hypothetical protein
MPLLEWPRTTAAALLLLGASFSHDASAQGRWVDDEQVLGAKRVRLSAGLGRVRFDSATSTDQARAFGGTGVNLEDSMGLGYDLEAGVRFGLRTDRAGQGLRADEAARVLDTETFGTGLSVAANPELRLRWRAAHWSWGEAGLEDRVVLPIHPDPNLTEVFGVWASFRRPRIVRLDTGVNTVLGWESFAGGRTLTWAFGFPVSIWTNLTDRLFLGAITTFHYFAQTPYTTSDAAWRAGVALGYRLGACDLLLSIALPDVFDDATRRIAYGSTVVCRL